MTSFGPARPGRRTPLHPSPNSVIPLSAAASAHRALGRGERARGARRARAPRRSSARGPRRPRWRVVEILGSAPPRRSVFAAPREGFFTTSAAASGPADPPRASAAQGLEREPPIEAAANFLWCSATSRRAVPASSRSLGAPIHPKPLRRTSSPLPTSASAARRISAAGIVKRDAIWCAEREGPRRRLLAERPHHARRVPLRQRGRDEAAGLPRPPPRGIRVEHLAAAEHRADGPVHVRSAQHEAIAADHHHGLREAEAREHLALRGRLRGRLLPLGIAEQIDPPRAARRAHVHLRRGAAPDRLLRVEDARPARGWAARTGRP